MPVLTRCKEFLDKLKLHVPRQLLGRRVFFVYTHNNQYDRFKNGLKANTEISYHSMRALKEAYGCVFFLKLSGEKDWKIQQIQKDDIVIGHIGETFTACAQRTKNLVLFYPFVGHPFRLSATQMQIGPTREERELFAKCKKIILITSEYNEKVYLRETSNPWSSVFTQEQLCVVHQAMDFALYPRIKHSYETNNFIYIGHTGYMKNVPYAEKLVAPLETTFYQFGTGMEKAAKNVVKMGSFNHLNLEQLQSLPVLADFYLHAGLWEGQNVAILEAAARGFIPIVTRETGYPYEHPFLLRLHDDAYNDKVLRELLNLSAEEKKLLADDLHHKLITDPKHNNYKTFTKPLTGLHFDIE